MTSISKLVPGDIIRWPDGERATVTWVSEDGERFRVEGLRTLLRTTDNFTLDRRSRVDVPD